MKKADVVKIAYSIQRLYADFYSTLLPEINDTRFKTPSDIVTITPAVHDSLVFCHLACLVRLFVSLVLLLLMWLRFFPTSVNTRCM